MDSKNINFQITAFNSPENAYLDMIEPFFGSKGFFKTGPEHKALRLRPREIFGLILISHVLSKLSGGKWVPGTDPFGHDGTVTRIDDSKFRGLGRVYEQVFITDFTEKQKKMPIEEAVVEAIRSKSKKGKGYMSSTDLIVFADRTGTIGDLKKLADSIANEGYEAVYMIANSDSVDTKKNLSYLCVILKHPEYIRGPLSIKIDRRTGVGLVERMR